MFLIVLCFVFDITKVSQKVTFPHPIIVVFHTERSLPNIVCNPIYISRGLSVCFA